MSHFSDVIRDLRSQVSILERQVLELKVEIRVLKDVRAGDDARGPSDVLPRKSEFRSLNSGFVEPGSDDYGVD